SAVLKHLYASFFPRIGNFIKSNSGTEEDARDIFQDAVMVVFEKSRTPSFKLSSSLFTFLYSVCRNLWLKKLRKKDRQGVTLEQDLVSIDDPVEMEASELTRHAQYQLYRKKFRELGDQCRQLMQLSLEGKRMREIVEKMGFSSEQYARKRKFKCKEKLIRLIRQDPEFVHLSLTEN
ncbi:MAG: sigma-70 family RNA polymerase sigma factor, partial [Bacteroidota bacterium]